MHHHPGELSKVALRNLYESKPEGARFKEMAQKLAIDEQSLSKNLFWLEEHGLVKLSTSLAATSTFPKIVMVKLTREGKALAADSSKLEKRFPIDDQSGLHTYRDHLEVLANDIKNEPNLAELERHQALDAIKVLLSLPLIDKKLA